MRLNRFSGLCLLMAVLQILATSASAYEKESRIPLTGCRQYHNASGSVRLYEIRRVNKEKDREELFVEVKNVPLTPGTILVVSIDDEQVGRITLDSKLSGKLKLTSEFRKSIPTLGPGTRVSITTVEGRLVLR